MNRVLRHSCFSFVVTIAAVSTLACSARAETDDTALAETLFGSARALIAEGKYAEACPKLVESQRLQPKLGTLLNLALCHEKEGKTASAWAEYKQAAEIAARTHQDERATVARESAAKLAVVLVHVTIHASPDSDVTITLDGHTIRPAALDTPIPVDRGTHEVRATAPKHGPFTTTLTVGESGGDQSVTIPTLDPEIRPPPDAAPLVAEPTPPLAATPGKHSMVGLALLGAGGAAIVTGAIFGAVAFAEQSAVNRECGPSHCPQSGLNDITVQKVSEAVSTLAIGAGLVAVGAGIYVVVRAKPHEPALAPVSLWLTPVVAPHGSGIDLSVSF